MATCAVSLAPRVALGEGEDVSSPYVSHQHAVCHFHEFLNTSVTIGLVKSSAIGRRSARGQPFGIQTVGGARFGPTAQCRAQQHSQHPRQGDRLKRAKVVRRPANELDETPPSGFGDSGASVRRPRFTTIADYLRRFFHGCGTRTVSTTVEAGRLRASRTVTYRPVRASRPTLAMMTLVNVSGFVIVVTEPLRPQAASVPFRAAGPLPAHRISGPTILS
jgi:hypothetical protein